MNNNQTAVNIATVGDLLGYMALRAAQLSEMKIKELRAMHPDNIEQQWDQHYTRAECVEAILLEEFDTPALEQPLDCSIVVVMEISNKEKQNE